MKITPAEQKALEQAYELAQFALQNGDVPVGAVLLDSNGQIVASGYNTKEKAKDPLGHAELMAIAQAAKLKKSWRLNDLTLVVTLEPCLMCAGAILAARIPRLVFGTWDEKAGACGSLRDVVRDSRINHQVEVVCSPEQSKFRTQLQTFFSQHR